MEVNITELSDKKTIHDYPDDTIFVWSEKRRRKIDPKTGYPIYDSSEDSSERDSK